MTGEHLSADIQELLRLFHEHRVRYLIVGGEAVIHHGYARLTAEVDLFYDRAPANCRRLFRALSTFWNGDVPAVQDADELAERGVIVQFGLPPNRVDLLSALVGVDFASAWRRRVTERLVPDEGDAFPVYFIGLEDLVRNKRRAGRHKDLDDVDHLSSLLRRRPRRR